MLQKLLLQELTSTGRIHAFLYSYRRSVATSTIEISSRNGFMHETITDLLRRRRTSTLVSFPRRANERIVLDRSFGRYRYCIQSQNMTISQSSVYSIRIAMDTEGLQGLTPGRLHSRPVSCGMARCHWAGAGIAIVRWHRASLL